MVYDIVGHSGESAEIPFVSATAPPENEADRLKVLRAMHAHSQFCYSGDHTLQAARQAIEKLGEREDSDERYVIVLFMGYARNKSGRPAGWAMRRHTELVAAAAKASDGKDEL